MQPFSLKVNSTAIYTHTIIIYIYMYTIYIHTIIYIYTIYTQTYICTQKHEDTILVPFSRAGKMVQRIKCFLCRLNDLLRFLCLYSPSDLQ